MQRNTNSVGILFLVTFVALYSLTIFHQGFAVPRGPRCRRKYRRPNYGREHFSSVSEFIF